jgi:aldehyde dehydrogenase (NAD+)
MYIFSKNRGHIERLIAQTRTGGTAVNNTLVQFFNPNLPFGGFSQSGMGNAHGFYGFREFSNTRAVLYQYNPGFLNLMMPPYNRLKALIADLAIRWL